MRRFVVIAVLIMLLLPTLAVAVAAPEVSSGLRISRLYWTSAAAGDVYIRYRLTCVVTNTSKKSFATVRGEGSLMRRNDNTQVKTFAAKTINLAPGDSWEWEAANFLLERGRNVNAYYGRVDRVIGSYAN